MDIYQEISAFYESISTQKRIYGKSLFGRNLYAVKLGEGNPVGLAQYAIHGREFITAKLAVEQFLQGGIFGSVWLLPLTNPDGALLSQRGVQTAAKGWQTALLRYNGGGQDFSLWKANGRGVDLNVNFPAKWGQGVKNTRVPGGENYIGTAPLSEPETLALQAFTLEIKPDYTLSYHTKGEEIYWYFYQPEKERDRALGEVLSKSTGYPLADAYGSAGGYKDWCIQELRIPAFTVEVGKDVFSHPLGDSALEDILRHNRFSLQHLSKAIKERIFL